MHFGIGQIDNTSQYSFRTSSLTLGCHLLSELRRMHWNSILNRFLLKMSFHSVLTFIYFCYLFYSLVFISCCFECLLILILSDFVLNLQWNIQWRWSLSTYVYCVVCYRVIVAPYIRSVGHVFANLYTLDDDSERPMNCDTSLLPKVFPSLEHVEAFIIHFKDHYPFSPPFLS